MNKRSHTERCTECKKNIKNFLTSLFGQVETNWYSSLSCRLEDYKNTDLYEILGPIHEAILRHRGFVNFVKSKKLPGIDFFMPRKNLIVEFDESQHFTKPRDISLSLYPDNNKYGFSVSRWRALCHELNKRDNDPPYRDEQRAWYDTLRDFVPMIFGGGPTIRLYSRDQIWCTLNPNSENDLQFFKKIIDNSGGS
jgi:hypothetical protein